MHLSALAAVVLLLILPACDVLGPDEEAPYAVRVGETGIVMEPGEVLTLSLDVRDERHGGPVENPRAHWWTDAPDVVRISDDVSGRIEALSPGTAAIWVEVGGSRDSATVVVFDEGAAPSHRWSAVSSARTGACALDVAGAAYCWGSNTFGRLGNGTRRTLTHTYRPVRVNAPAAFEEIGAGNHFACGRTGGGEVWCWGAHLGALLGHGRTDVEHEVEPVRVDFAGRAEALTVGMQHACILDEEGNAHCWGANHVHQLGSGMDVPSSADLGGRTVAVDFDGSFTEISGTGNSTCGLTAGRDLYCWGETFGGSGTIGQRSSRPARIASPVEVHGPSPGDGGTCFLSDVGDVFCWGYNMRGQAGHPPGGSFQIPTLAEIPIQFQQVRATGGSTCGISTDGIAWCWGSNAFSFFDPELVPEPCDPSGWGCTGSPVPVAGDHRFRVLSLSTAACGVTDDHELYCWGRNENGQLGIGRPDVEATPVPQRVLDPL